MTNVSHQKHLEELVRRYVVYIEKFSNEKVRIHHCSYHSDNVNIDRGFHPFAQEDLKKVYNKEGFYLKDQYIGENEKDASMKVHKIIENAMII